ncbi:restriction endonuclease subunit S [Acetobacter fabarum]|uniref:restriction endonuclease subunit S n=1 Tax=Acetobacter fabarum TaxID=483199 RepID=UPI00312BA8E6
MSKVCLQEWPKKKLADLCEINIGGTPSRSVPAFWVEPPEGYPWLSIADIKEKYLSETREHITDLGARSSNVKAIAPDTMIMSFKLSVGKAGIVKAPMYCNEAIAIFQPFHGQIDYRWLYFALPRVAATAITDTAVKGATFNKASLANLTLTVPDVSIQSKIAEILDTLDTAIRGTEAVVAKLKAMKQGLLHDLLTRGIDANGDLRPPQSEVPHLYKQTPLGWLPKEWEVCAMQDLLASVDPAMRSGPFGSALLKEELVSKGIPFLGIDNVFVERFDRNYKRFVTPRKFVQLHRYAVRPDDLMITIMGTVGRCCLVPDDVGEALSSKHTWTISLDQTKYSPYLAMLQVNYSDWVLRHFSKDQQGGTMSAIRSETIRSTQLPVPPRDEQESIEAILSELSVRLSEEETILKKYSLQKIGLMDDLLTGRTSVTPLL